MLAIFDNLGFSELMIVVVAAILIFGKRLPEVASQAGQQLAKFRRSLQDLKNETGIDSEMRKIQRDIQEAVPRDLSMGEMARIASLELEKRMKASGEPKAIEASKTSAENASSAAPAAGASASTAEAPHAPSPTSAPASEATHADAASKATESASHSAPSHDARRD
jgi:Sec-independent protein translocase protein TatA